MPWLFPKHVDPFWPGPGIKPSGPLRVKAEWLGKGLQSAWIFGKNGATDIAFNRTATLADVNLGSDYAETKGLSGSYIDLPVFNVATNPPYSFVYDMEILSGPIAWSYVRNYYAWTGIYHVISIVRPTTSNYNDFSGQIFPTGPALNQNVYALSHSNNNFRGVYNNGNIETDTNAVAPTTIDRNFATIGAGRASSLDYFSNVKVRLFLSFNQILSDADLRLLSSNAYEVFEPANQSPFLIGVSGGAGSITGTGDLDAQVANISGTGEITHTGTGDLDAQASALSGTGSISGAITGTGDLDAQTSAVAGTGEITHTGTGDLDAQTSAVAGTGEITHTGTGDLDAQTSAVAGTGEITHTGTGDLDAQASVVSGTGTLEGAITGTGALAAQTSSAAGTGEITHTGTGALVATAADVIASGTITGPVTGTGALDAQTSAVSGTGEITHTGTGDLDAQASAVSGTGNITQELTGTGALAAQASSISGYDVLVIWTEVTPTSSVWTETAADSTIWTEI